MSLCKALDVQIARSGLTGRIDLANPRYQEYLTRIDAIGVANDRSVCFLDLGVTPPEAKGGPANAPEAVAACDFGGQARPRGLRIRRT